MKRLLVWLAVIGVVAAAATFVVTGISLVPTTISLGPCLKDYTSTFWQHRPSPLASVRFSAGEVNGLVCYGRPSARDRLVFGGLVAYGRLWRTGANEPTRLYLDGPVELAGIPLAAGRYSIYTRPDTATWEIYLNESVTHWGNDLRDVVRDSEVGSAKVAPDSTAEYVETFTISAESRPDTALLVLEWENTRVAIPVVGRR